jgi:hypothetical protein
MRKRTFAFTITAKRYSLTNICRFQYTPFSCHFHLIEVLPQTKPGCTVEISRRKERKVAAIFNTDHFHVEGNEG